MSTWTDQDIKSIREINIENIPECLKKLNQWVVWGGFIDADGKPNKAPINPKTNEKAASTRSSEWGSFEQALSCKKAKGKYGIGFVVSAEDDYVGIDLDDCIDENGNTNVEAVTIIMSFNSYTEITPSQKGIHILIKGKLPSGYMNKSIRDGHEYEVYDRSRYFTVTGHRYPNTSHTVEERQFMLQKFCDTYMKKDEVKVAPISITAKHSFSNLELIEKIKSSAQGDKFTRLYEQGDLSDYQDDDSRADQALLNILSFWCQKDRTKIEQLMSLSALGRREKWRDRKDYRDRSISNAIAHTMEVYTQQRKQPEELILTIEEVDDLDKKKDIKFPHEIMSGIAKKYVDMFSEFESPPQFWYWGFLTALGMLFSDSVTLETELNTSPRLYTILLGESATTKKSTVINKVAQLLEDYQFASADLYKVIHGLGSEVGLSERLTELDTDVKRALICFDELRHFVMKASIKNSALLNVVGTLFETHKIADNTKTSNINISNAYISMLAASTIATYETIFTENFTNIGFINRLWIVPGDADKRSPRPGIIPDFKKKEIIDSLILLRDKIPSRLVIPINQDADELYKTWYNNLPRSEYASRLDTYIFRLMILLALNDFKDHIDVETMEKAITLCNWQFNVRKRYAPIDADNINALFEAKIKSLLSPEWTHASDLKHRMRRHTKRYGLRVYVKTLELLTQYGEVEQAKIDTKKGKVLALRLMRDEDYVA